MRTILNSIVITLILLGSFNEKTLAQPSQPETINFQDALARNYIKLTISSTETDQFIHMTLEKNVEIPFIVKFDIGINLRLDELSLRTGKSEYILIGPIRPVTFNFTELNQKEFVLARQLGSMRYLIISEGVKSDGSKHQRISIIMASNETSFGKNSRLESDSVIQEIWTGDKLGKVYVNRYFNKNGLFKRTLNLDSTSLGEVYTNVTVNWDEKIFEGKTKHDYIVEFVPSIGKVLRSLSTDLNLTTGGVLSTNLSDSKKQMVNSTNIDGMKNKVEQNNTMVSSSFNKSSSFFRKGVITIEMAYLFGSNLAGQEVNQLIDAENDYLIDLGMVETQTNSSGQVISSTPIDEYSYGTDYMVGGFRMLYFTSPKMSLGFHYYFIDYSQELTVLDQTEFGSLLSIYFFGPSINYFPYQKNKFGISLKGNIGLVSGTSSSLPALYELSSNGAFDDISGLSSRIINSRSTADISGVEANIGVAANWFICRWFSLDAGLTLYSYNGILTNSIWAGTPTSFTVFKPVFTMGVNFHLFNKNK